MAGNNPSITFLFPYRWLTDDKEYFSQNIQRMIEARVGGKEDMKILEEIMKYRVILSCRYHKMIRIPVSKLQVEKALKPIFTNGKCLSVDVEYQTSRSKTVLPMIDFQVFF